MATQPQEIDRPPNYTFGRPSPYREAFCEKVIEWGKYGKSRTWFAAELGVSRKTLLEWRSAYPDFRAALEIADAFSQQWWEDAGQSGMTSEDPFNAAIWSRSMAARFPEEWREKKDLTVTDDREPSQFDIRLLPAEHREQFRQLLVMMLPPEQQALMAPIEGEFTEASQDDG